MKIYSAHHRAIVEAPIMEKPNIESTKYSYRTYSWECDAFDAPKFEADTKAYQEWLKTHIPVLPEHQHLFKDGQEVKEGIDYEVELQVFSNKNKKWGIARYGEWFTEKRTVAIPIKQQVSAGDAWLEYIKQFPKLQEIWNMIGEPTNIYLRQQIDIFAGKYPSEEDKEPLPQQEVESEILRAYYEGFNQAHYGHLHPDVCPPKECESAGIEYLESRKKYIKSQLSEALATIKSQEAEIADLRKQLKS
jgi:hypothetical protein